ncbi:hypothetical protein JCM6882_000089 [Rhodosporidiobolus microsporus]
MANFNQQSNSYNRRGALAGIATQAYTFPRADSGPDIATPRRSPAAGLKGQGTRTAVREPTRSVSVSRSASVSLSTSPASPTSSDDESDTDTLFDEPLPAYTNDDAPLSPASSISTSPTDSFLALKSRTAAPLLSPPYTHSAAGNPLEAAAPSLLSTIFPSASSAVHSLPATSVEVSDLIGAGWKGVVVNDADAGLRTLYVHGGEIDELEMREAVVDLVDRAEEQWGVNGVVLALAKETEELGSLVHGLTYVGFTPLSKPEVNDSLLLLALDLA